MLRRARLAALAVGSFLLPWCMVLAVTLPATAPARHWALAWVGLDGGEALPFADAQFDAAYLVTVLGEIPRPLAALTELRRVLKPGGRLVIGEFADRHHITLPTLVRLANDAGLHFRRRTGVPLAYYALLTPCGGAGRPVAVAREGDLLGTYEAAGLD